MNERTLQEFERWEDCVTDEELRADLTHMRVDLDGGNTQTVEDAFFTTLSFGTGGLRGIMGAGSNRMNVLTIAQATQGLADYLNERFEDPSVAIAHDSRKNGTRFAETIASVLAANGICAWLYPRLEPTPALSFAVRDLGCSAGINVTASHNPSEYSGYKVYGADGCQATTQASHDIQQAIAAVDIFDGVASMPFDEALSCGMAKYIPEDTLDRFLDAVAANSTNTANDQLKVVYTPLNGTGMECVERILERVGVTDVSVVAEQAEPDGDFPTCPYPNPESRDALELGVQLLQSTSADVLIATDPDADRVGTAVPYHNDVRLLTGNEVGILLTDWLASAAAARGEDLRKKVVLSTVVSSAMLDALAAKHGFELRRTLTGFKYIGEQIGMLESAGEADRFLIGFEESYGYLVGTHVRDKDAIVATMLVCEMACNLRARGLSLADAIDALYAELGFYTNCTISPTYPGASGAQTMRQLMDNLRCNPPQEIAGFAVERIVDYATGAPMPVVGGYGDSDIQILPQADVVEFDLAEGNKIIVRPSGTEPKVKAYIFACAQNAMDAQERTRMLEQAAKELLHA